LKPTLNAVRNTNRQEKIDAALKLVDVPPGAAAILTASYADGLENTESDIDIYVITDDLPLITSEIIGSHHWVAEAGFEWDVRVGAELCETFDYLNEEGLSVNARYLREDVLVDEIAKIDESFTNVIDTYDDGTDFDYTLDFAMIHRLIIAKPLVNADRLKALVDRINQAKFRYLAFKRQSSSWDKIKDLIGSWRERDLETSCWHAERILASTCLAYLSLLGRTNPNPKWLWKLTRHVPQADVIDFGRMRNLLFSDRRTADAKRHFVLDAVNLTDAFRARSVETLVELIGLDAVEGMKAKALADFEQRAHPQGKLEALWWANQYGHGAWPTRCLLENPSPRLP
jgi:hypothetical protein